MVAYERLLIKKNACNALLYAEVDSVGIAYPLNHLAPSSTKPCGDPKTKTQTYTQTYKSTPWDSRVKNNRPRKFFQPPLLSYPPLTILKRLKLVVNIRMAIPTQFYPSFVFHCNLLKLYFLNKKLFNCCFKFFGPQIDQLIITEVSFTLD